MKTKSAKCPDCGVKKGQLHHSGCLKEQCPQCGRQLLFCPHYFRKPPSDKKRVPWTGEAWGKVECREYGYFMKTDPWGLTVPCAADDPDGLPDANRLTSEADWDRKQKRYVLPDNLGTASGSTPRVKDRVPGPHHPVLYRFSSFPDCNSRQ